MENEAWEMVDKISGSMQADMIRGLLEAQGIQVVLMQEGVGYNVFPVNVGPFSEVEIYVQTKDVDNAKQILTSYYAGDYELGPSNNDGPQDNSSDG